eukprot:15325104-Ditylum_brightwellii.AAC.1
MFSSMNPDKAIENFKLETGIDILNNFPWSKLQVTYSEWSDRDSSQAMHSKWITKSLSGILCQCIRDETLLSYETCFYDGIGAQENPAPDSFLHTLGKMGYHPHECFVLFKLLAWRCLDF